MNDLQGIRHRCVRVALIFVLVAGSIAAFFGLAAIGGVALGAAAGALGFLHLAERIARFDPHNPARPFEREAMRGLALRVGLYTAAMLLAYALDMRDLRGLLAAGVSLMVLRMILIVVVWVDGAPPRDT